MHYYILTYRSPESMPTVETLFSSDFYKRLQAIVGPDNCCIPHPGCFLFRSDDDGITDIIKIDEEFTRHLPSAYTCFEVNDFSDSEKFAGILLPQMEDYKVFTRGVDGFERWLSKKVESGQYDYEKILNRLLPYSKHPDIVKKYMEIAKTKNPSIADTKFMEFSNMLERTYNIKDNQEELYKEFLKIINHV